MRWGVMQIKPLLSLGKLPVREKDKTLGLTSEKKCVVVRGGASPLT